MCIRDRFYTGGSEGTLVSGSASLSPDDIRLESNLPAAPASTTAAVRYELTVPASGAPTWEMV